MRSPSRPKQTGSHGLSIAAPDASLLSAIILNLFRNPRERILSEFTENSSASPPVPLCAFQRPMPEGTREELKHMLLEKSVRTGEFTLASGTKSDLYVDCRVTSFDSRGARLIGELGWAAVHQKLIADGLTADAIGGMTLGADPISLSIGVESARSQPQEYLQVFTVRKEAKGYGAGKRIEGNFTPGKAVVVVDDVITTGGSTLKAIDAIEAEGGRILFAFVLVDREEGGRQALEARGIDVVPLFTRSTLLG